MNTRAWAGLMHPTLSPRRDRVITSRNGARFTSTSAELLNSQGAVRVPHMKFLSNSPAVRGHRFIATGVKAGVYASTREQ